MIFNNSIHAKPKLLIISHVYPFPGESGQQMRVRYKMESLRRHFRIAFLTYADPKDVVQIKSILDEFCDRAIVFPSRYKRGILAKIFYRFTGFFYQLITGIKFSNFLIGKIEFTPARLKDYLYSSDFDCVLTEYWHLAKNLFLFQDKDIPCVLDMHDILWQSYDHQLKNKPLVPKWWKRFALSRYKENEERAWQLYDALIAINQDELEYAQKMVNKSVRLFYAPMGTDLDIWPYSWQPAYPPRLVYYGGLGSSLNQYNALVCYEQIMPPIWNKNPQVELWLVGSHPPEKIKALPKKDQRVFVTGYIEQVQNTLNTMTALLCPWSGTYGFRSRLIEVMALGVPVVASPDAVAGMDLNEGEGILIGQDSEQIAQKTIHLLEKPDLCHQQSQLARKQVERSFSLENTYGKLAQELHDWVVVNKPFQA